MSDDRQVGAFGGFGFGGCWWIWIIIIIILLCCCCGGFGYGIDPKE